MFSVFPNAPTWRTLPLAGYCAIADRHKRGDTRFRGLVLGVFLEDDLVSLCDASHCGSSSLPRRHCISAKIQKAVIRSPVPVRLTGEPCAGSNPAKRICQTSVR